jgi:hypothetical protein
MKPSEPSFSLSTELPSMAMTKYTEIKKKVLKIIQNYSVKANVNIKYGM